MEREKLRAILVTHLDTLRRNLEVVSIEVLKTKYEKENMSRIILLCVLNVKNEDDLKRIANLKGWFWNNSHIEDNLNHHIFSECFEQEFEFLKNTILLAYQYKAENTIK